MDLKNCQMLSIELENGLDGSRDESASAYSLARAFVTLMRWAILYQYIGRRRIAFCGDHSMRISVDSSAKSPVKLIIAITRLSDSY